MAREKFKPDLSRLSINQLQELTGSSYRTLKKRLADLAPSETNGNTLFYDPRLALPLIFQSEAGGEGKNGDGAPGRLNAIDENAKLARARTRKVELETQVIEGTLIPAEQVDGAWSDMVLAFRAKILAVPTRVSPLLVGKSIFEIQEIIRGIMKEALTELSSYDPEQNHLETGEESGEQSGATAGSDGESVGESIPETLGGSEPGAGEI